MMTFEELQELVAHCTAPDGAAFYRRVYGLDPSAPALTLKTPDEWHALRAISKRDLLECPIAERTYLPWNDVDSIETTSGTSGKPPIFIPWALNNGYGYRSRYHTFERATLSSTAALQQQEWILENNPTPSRLVVLDPKAPAASVRLARAAGVDSMFIFLYHILAIADEMKKQRLAEQIRFIEFYGEPCTTSTYKFIRDTFPNAVITSEYASKEVESNPIGVLCRPITGLEPLEVYHANEHSLIELIDSATGSIMPISEGAEGEILITAGRPRTSAFPLIRYRIGDMVRVVDEHCDAHHAWSFQILGRSEIDFIRVPGGTIRVDEVERVLASLGNSRPDDFQMLVREGTPGKGALIAATLFLPQDADRSANSTDQISRTLRVGPSFTYADGVQRGIYAPLECAILEQPTSPAKRKRMLYRPSS